MSEQPLTPAMIPAEYKALAVIGLRVPIDRLNKKGDDLVTRWLDEEGKFTAERRPERLFTWPVIPCLNDDVVFVALDVTGEVTDSAPGKPKHQGKPINFWLTEAGYNFFKHKLGVIGLWREEDFGLWAVMGF